jgi:hypothetical protein
MALTILTGSSQAAATNYSYSTNGSSDWTSVPTASYFYDLVDKIARFKDTTGVIQNAYRNLPAVQSVTSSATVTPTANNDLVIITAQSASLTIANPTGTWSEGQALMIRIKDNATARAITWDTNYRAIGVTLPTTTTLSKTTYVGLIYNSTDTKWDATGVVTQA